MLKVEEIVGALTDLLDKFTLYYSVKVDKEKEDIIKNIVDNEIPYWASKYDKIIEENGKDGFFIGKSLCVADIYAYTVFQSIVSNMSGFVKGIPANCLDKYANI